MISCTWLSSTENIKNIAETIAIFAAAGYFLYKALTGWLVANLEISIETDRHSTDKKDLLAFKINLKKGSIDTLQIKDIKARIYTINMVTQQIEEIIQEFDFSEIERLKVDNKGKILWGSTIKKNVSLSPNESFHLGRYCEVTKGQPVIVEAVLFGDRTFWKKGFQWKATVVSMPPKKDAKE